MILAIRNYLKEFADLIIPRHCIVCQCKLYITEEYLCFDCDLKMPISNHITLKDNALKQRLEVYFAVERACAYFNYSKENTYSNILYQLKYRNQAKIGQLMGRSFGQLLKEDIEISSAHYICPVPLHPKRERARGYNQSYQLALGLSEVLNIPIAKNNLVRKVNTKTQTKMNRRSRLQNMENVFELKDAHLFEGKHIILLDDVVTTGATIQACAYAIQKACNAKISVLCLASVD